MEVKRGKLRGWANRDPRKAYDIGVIQIAQHGRCISAVTRPERWHLTIPELREVKLDDTRRLKFAALTRSLDQNTIVALARSLDQNCGISGFQNCGSEAGHAVTKTPLHTRSRSNELRCMVAALARSVCQNGGTVGFQCSG